MDTIRQGIKPPSYLHRVVLKKRGMTLIEIMVAMGAFAIAVLGGISVMIFSLKTMDQVRANTQITQILLSEMEAIRMRTWLDRNVSSTRGGVLYGIKSLGMAQSANGTGADLRANTDDNEVALGPVTDNIGRVWQAYRVEPFAVYGTRITKTAPGKIVARVGEDVSVGSVQLRVPYDKLEIKRYVRLVSSDPSIALPDMARIYITAEWSDRLGKHSKGIATTVSRYGINDYIVRSVTAP